MTTVTELQSAFTDLVTTDDRSALADRADEHGVLDVTYRTVDSPFGALLVAATATGVVRIAFAVEGHDAVLQAVADTVSPRILATSRRVDPVARQLDEYFAGRRRHFEVPLDLRLAHGFRREVLDRLLEIPYGRTESYAEVARSTGSPRAVRAVGSACSHNPVPLVVPCHRVVRSDGTIGNYLGGTAMKKALLVLERSGSR
jgi:methylated-DNA-[protein]-cysteine S-methyltransferase